MHDSRLKYVSFTLVACAILVPVLTAVLNDTLNSYAISKAVKSGKRVSGPTMQSYDPFGREEPYYIGSMSIINNNNVSEHISGSVLWRFFEWGLISGDKEELPSDIALRNAGVPYELISFVNLSNPPPATIYFLLIISACIVLLKELATRSYIQTRVTVSRKIGCVLFFVIGLILIMSDMPYLVTGTDMIYGKIRESNTGVKDMLYILTSMIFFLMSISLIEKRFMWLLAGIFILIESIHLSIFSFNILRPIGDTESFKISLIISATFFVLGCALIVTGLIIKNKYRQTKALDTQKA